MKQMAMTVDDRHSIPSITYLVWSGRFDPLTRVHRAIGTTLAKVAMEIQLMQPNKVCKVIVWPHAPYNDKAVQVPAEIRKRWLERCFHGRNYLLRYDDLGRTDGGYTSRFEMQRLFEKTILVDGGGSTVGEVSSSVIHVIGADNVPHIRDWVEPNFLWTKCHWLVFPRKDMVVQQWPHCYNVVPKSMFVPSAGSAKAIREMIAAGTPGWEELVAGPYVASDIKENRLYHCAS